MKINPLILLSSVVLLFTACGNNEPASQMPAAMPYPVVEIPQRSITGYTAYPVSIEGTVNSAVQPKISGYITKVLVDEGQPVKEGQSLFTLETLSLTQDAGAAQANVQAAQVEVNRLQPLVEKNIISPVQLKTAEARLAQAKANFNSISASIEYATIKSPIDGYVGAIPYREGSLVSPADPTPLTTVSDIDSVYAYFSMNEKDYLNFILNTEGETLNEKIQNFPPVGLVLVNGSTYNETGHIETVTRQVNVNTGTVSFRAKFPNPNRILINGNSGMIRIPKIYEDRPLVPEISTYEQQGLVYVYKVVGDSVAVSNPIVVADRIENIIVVKSGLEAGDKIVAKGIGKLRHNTPILPKPIPFDSIANSIQVVFK